jgi:hypothetical protein
MSGSKRWALAGILTVAFAGAALYAGDVNAQQRGAEPAVITFLTAECPPESVMAVAVTVGKDPTSRDNGTAEAVPGDIAAYGCTERNLDYRLYLMAGSSSKRTYTDDALEDEARINADDAAWDGAATTIGTGESFYAPGDRAATRRLSIAEFAHKGSAWIGLPFLDLQCYDDGINNDNGDGVGWNNVSLAAGQQVYCILYAAGAAAEPTPTASPTTTATIEPTATPTGASAETTATPTEENPPPGQGQPVGPVEADEAVGKRPHPDYQVDEATGIVTWIIWPNDRGDKLYVWDAQAETCEAFGGAKCGGIGEGGGPGEFNPGLGNDQHLIVTQSFDAAGGQCEVSNSVSWAEKRNDDEVERLSTTATYTCSGANALGWPLLAVGFAAAAVAAWVVKQRASWPRP